MKENSRVVRVASTTGTLTIQGGVSMEITDDQDIDDLEWSEYVDRMEDFDETVSYEFREDGYTPEISSKVKMTPFSEYEKSLSTPESKVA